MREELDETMKDTTELGSELTNLSTEYKELERATKEELIGMQNEVNNLMTTIHTQTEELETQKRTNLDLEVKCSEN